MNGIVSLKDNYYQKNMGMLDSKYVCLFIFLSFFNITNFLEKWMLTEQYFQRFYLSRSNKIKKENIDTI